MHFQSLDGVLTVQTLRVAILQDENLTQAQQSEDNGYGEIFTAESDAFSTAHPKNVCHVTTISETVQGKRALCVKLLCFHYGVAFYSDLFVMCIWGRRQSVMFWEVQ